MNDAQAAPTPQAPAPAVAVPTQAGPAPSTAQAVGVAKTALRMLVDKVDGEARVLAHYALNAVHDAEVAMLAASQKEVKMHPYVAIAIVAAISMVIGAFLGRLV